MARDKLLAEWFWTDRWTGSSAFLLPQEARGVYREMLTQAWRRGARLPNDHDAIQRATGTTPEEWARSWPLIERYWRVKKESLVNPTQVRIYAATVTLQHTRSAAGRRGGLKAQALKRQAKLEAKPKAQPEAKPDSLSPSPSLSPRSENEKSDRAHTRGTTTIFGRNPHLDHSACDVSLSRCVPSAMHRKLSDLLAPKYGGDRDATMDALQAWYPTVWATLPADFIMGDAFRFWQARFDAAFATPDPRSNSRRLIETTVEEDAAAVLAMLRKERGA